MSSNPNEDDDDKSKAATGAGDAAEGKEASSKGLPSFDPLNYSLKDEKNVFKIYFNYVESPGDVITVDQVPDEDNRGCHVRFQVMRQHGNNLLYKSQVIPSSEMSKFELVNDKEVTQTKRDQGKYKVKLKKKDAKVKLQQYFSYKAPRSSGSSSSDGGS